MPDEWNGGDPPEVSYPPRLAADLRRSEARAEDAHARIDDVEARPIPNLPTVPEGSLLGGGKNGLEAVSAREILGRGAEFPVVCAQGSDLTDRLTAALAAALSGGGGVVTLPAGFFELSRPLPVMPEPVRIVGAGNGRTLIAYTGEDTTSALFDFDGLSSPRRRIEGCGLIGVDVSCTRAGYSFLHANTVCRFSACVHASLRDSRLRGFLHADGVGASVENDTQHLNIDGVELYAGTGLSLISSWATVARDLKLNGCTRYGAYIRGSQVFFWAGGLIQGTTPIGVFLDGPYAQCVTIDGVYTEMGRGCTDLIRASRVANLTVRGCKLSIASPDPVRLVNIDHCTSFALLNCRTPYAPTIELLRSVSSFGEVSGGELVESTDDPDVVLNIDGVSRIVLRSARLGYRVAGQPGAKL